MSNGIGKNPLNDISKVYLEHIAGKVSEDSKYGYDKDGNSLNPVDIEKRKKEDDDLFGSPNKKGKKKAKRWWDDDGDGKGYEKGEVKKEDKNWIQGAVKRPGAFTKKAKAAGMSVQKFAKHVDDNKDKYSARTERQANLAQTFASMKKEGAESPAAEEEKLKKDDKLFGSPNPKKKFKKESFSNWRTDLSEVLLQAEYVDEIEPKAEKEVKEKKVNNKVIINPKLGEAVAEMGGELLKAGELSEKDLSAAERRALPDSDFALPGKGKGPEGKQAGSYPIPDKEHARMALAMVAKHGTAEEKKKVRAAVARKFPGIQQENYELDEKENYKTVAAVIDYDRAKKGSKYADYDSLHGKKKEAKKERDYAAWERSKMKRDDPNWKHRKYHTGMHGEGVESPEKIEANRRKDDDLAGSPNDPKQKKADVIKKQVLLKKLQAVRSGGGSQITASYEPKIESAVEYFYEEGINGEGLDLIIEEIGLESFVDFIDESAVDLNEERAARRASVRAKSYADVKADIDKKDAAKKKAVGPVKQMAKRRADDDLAGAPLQKKPSAKKVVKAVAKAKPAQSKKPASKETLRDKITTAYKAGVKRHKKAVQPARVFAKGAVKGAKDTVKFAGKVKKAVVGEATKNQVKKELKDLEKAGKTLKGKWVAKADEVEEEVVHEAQSSYDKARKAAARRAAARNAERRAGTRGGRMERETYTSEAGARMHYKGYRVKEDKAFDNVVGALRKKHGEAGVLTKDSPKPKAKPLDAKQIWKRDARNAAKREREADSRSADQKMRDAVYGVSAANPKGFPLRT